MAEPYYDSDGVQIWHGDAKEVLAGMADESVQMVCTSPPYW